MDARDARLERGRGPRAAGSVARRARPPAGLRVQRAGERDLLPGGDEQGPQLPRAARGREPHRAGGRRRRGAARAARRGRRRQRRTRARDAREPAADAAVTQRSAGRQARGCAVAVGGGGRPHRAVRVVPRTRPRGRRCRAGHRHRGGNAAGHRPDRVRHQRQRARTDQSHEPLDLPVRAAGAVRSDAAAHRGPAGLGGGAGAAGQPDHRR